MNPPANPFRTATHDDSPAEDAAPFTGPGVDTRSTTQSPAAAAFAARLAALAGGEDATTDGGPTAGADAPPSVPGYEVSRELARGGMGVVYAARDLSLNREVAVKTVLAGRAAAARARFVYEAHVTGQLDHPGVPPVHALGELSDGRPFLAMKLIRGRTLADLLKARPTPAADLPRFVQAFEQVCQAVGFAHARGFIHRDLKPANVMVGAFAEVQVMDWGLARAGDRRQEARGAEDQEAGFAATRGTDTPHETTAGAVLGTPAYMAAEQARGEAVDERADVFALGGVLCDVLTGRPPFVGKSALETVRAAAAGAVGEAFARLDACGADPDLIALAKRCLDPVPQNRPADGKAVADAVAAYRAGVEDRLRKAERERAVAAAEAREQRKRRRVQLALAGLVAVLVSAGLAFAWWQDRQATERRAERDREEVRMREAVTAALDEAEKALRADDLPAAGAALARAKERLGDAGPDDLRGRYADLERDRDMVEALERLADGRVGRGALAAQADSSRPYKDSSRPYKDLFHRYGLDLTAGNPDEMAAQVTRSPIRSQLLAGLDATFLEVATNCPALLPLLKRVDGDPARTAVREAIAARDDDRVEDLVNGLAPSTLTPGFAVLVSYHSLPVSLRHRILQAVWERHPEHFGLNRALAWRSLGSEEETSEELATAMTHARILVALRPASPEAYSTLADVLEREKRYDEAIAATRKALELDPRKSWLRWSIAGLIGKRSGIDAEVAHLREEVARTPDDAELHSFLGGVLERQGEFNEAVAAYRRAVERNPTEGDYHVSLARTLEAAGRPDEAVAAYRRAVERDPTRAHYHYSLVVALEAAGQPDEAAAAARLAWQRHGASVHLLVDVLWRQRKYREALRVLESATPNFPGTDEDTRFYAGRLAALVATFHEDDPDPQGERPAFRRKALTWLREDLAGWRKKVATGPTRVRGEAHHWIMMCLLDTSFDGVREPEVLANHLPPAEAREWQAFWDEVRKFRDEIPPLKAPPPREVKRP